MRTLARTPRWLALMLAGLLIATEPGSSAAQSFFDLFRGPQQQPAPPPPVFEAPPPRRRPKPKPPKPEGPKVQNPTAPEGEEPPPPYEPQLLRLAEILGALTYLRDLCGAADAESWRARMQALLDVETTTAVRRDHLAGAYNRGFHGYELSYRACTDNAHVVIQRFLAEGEKISHEVASRYGAT